MSNWSSVGNTPLRQLETLAGEPLTPTVLIKDESTNPSGTHKDRKSKVMIQRAMVHNIDTLSIITAGNGAYSLAKLAHGTGIRIAAIISKTIAQERKEALHAAGADLYECDLDRQLESSDVINMTRNHAREKIWDVSNDAEDAYEDVFHEIADEKPKIIIAPLGSGELYLGIDRGMRRAGSSATLIGIGTMSSNSKADKLYASYKPLRDRIMLNQLRRPAPDRAHTDLTENEVDWCIRNAPPDLKAEPSALVPLIMIQRLRHISQKIIMISTGKGI